MLRGEDPDGVLGRVRSSSQDAVELLHYVTTRGHSKLTFRGLIEHVQLEELDREGTVSVR